MHHLPQITRIVKNLVAIGSLAIAAAANAALVNGPTFVVLGNNIRVPEFPEAADRIAGTNFATGKPGDVVVRAFQVRNTSLTTLTLTLPLTIGGSDAADYKFLMQPSAVIPPKQQSEFVIQLHFLGTGGRNAECTINSDSVATPTFQFRLSATGALDAQDPDIENVVVIDQPLKVKCTDGQCFVSGTVLAANSFVNSPLENSFVQIYAGTSEFADFANASDPILVKFPLVVPGKPVKFAKIKFTVPAPAGSFRVFARIFPSSKEPSFANNLAHADYIAPVE
jgi:hypothetical protein